MMSPTMNDAALGKNENKFDFKILPKDPNFTRILYKN